MLISFEVNNKRATTIINKLNKKISFKSASDLNDLCELVVLLYINDKYDEALEVCELTEDLEFNNDFRQWGVIHTIWMYHIRLLEESETQDLKINRIKELMDSHFKHSNKVSSAEKVYDLHLKILKRTTVEDITYKDKISLAKTKGDKLTWMFMALYKMIQPVALDNQAMINRDEVLELFDEYVDELLSDKKYKI